MVGVSYGGYVAQRLAVRHASIVRSLALCLTGMLGVNELETMPLREPIKCARLVLRQKRNGLTRGMSREQYVANRLDFIGLASSIRRTPHLVAGPLWHLTLGAVAAAGLACVAGRLDRGTCAAVTAATACAYGAARSCIRDPLDGHLDPADVRPLPPHTPSPPIPPK